MTKSLPVGMRRRQRHLWRIEVKAVTSTNHSATLIDRRRNPESKFTNQHNMPSFFLKIDWQDKKVAQFSNTAHGVFVTSIPRNTLVDNFFEIMGGNESNSMWGNSFSSKYRWKVRLLQLVRSPTYNFNFSDDGLTWQKKYCAFEILFWGYLSPPYPEILSSTIFWRLWEEMNPTP